MSQNGPILVVVSCDKSATDYPNFQGPFIYQQHKDRIEKKTIILN